MKKSQMLEARINQYHNEEVDLTVDFTGLNNVEMCPRWGGIRYGLGLAFESQGRAMALEAGKAAHDFFAAVRTVELFRQLDRDKARAFVVSQGVRLFGDRFADATDGAEEDKLDDIFMDEVGALNFCLNILTNGAFYDDPNDRLRTTANIEESCIAYYRDWPFGRWPVCVGDVDDPSSLVGIELPVDLLIEFEDELKLRYVGRMDGLHLHNYKRDGRDFTGPVVHENKTASRISDAWRVGQAMSHQAVGYAVQGSLYAKKPVERAMIHGMQIPQPRAEYGAGIIQFPINIDDVSIRDWVNWVYQQSMDMIKVMADPANGETRRHSCSRYFRPCSFYAICAERDPEDRKAMIAELVEDRWNPLEEEN